MQTNLIIAFANQKGGVGKSTLCTLFANYLVKRVTEPITIYDCDTQRTIYIKRQDDLDLFPNHKPLYSVEKFTLQTKGDCMEFTEKIKSLKGVILIDTPGGISNQILGFLMSICHFIVCPCNMELAVLDSTIEFSSSVKKIQRALGGRTNAQLFYLPNGLMRGWGNKKEHEHWEKICNYFKSNNNAIILPDIYKYSSPARFNTIKFMEDQEKHIGKCFDMLYAYIFNAPVSDQSKQLPVIESTEIGEVVEESVAKKLLNS